MLTFILYTAQFNWFVFFCVSTVNVQLSIELCNLSGVNEAMNCCQCTNHHSFFHNNKSEDTILLTRKWKRVIRAWEVMNDSCATDSTKFINGQLPWFRNIDSLESFVDVLQLLHFHCIKVTKWAHYDLKKKSLQSWF